MSSPIPHAATCTTLSGQMDDVKCISGMDKEDELVLLPVLLLTPAFENRVGIDRPVLGRGQRGGSKLLWLQLLNSGLVAACV